MPNWCENKLTVKGTHERAVEFMFKARGEMQHYALSEWEIKQKELERKLYPEKKEKIWVSDFSFHQLVPIPDEIMAKEYDPHGYTKEKELWGVKWGGSDAILISYKNGIIDYEFQTPWGPPTAFLETLALDWIDLSFALSFREEYPTRGRLLLKDGTLIEDICDQPNGRTSSGWWNKYYKAHSKWIKEVL